MIMPATTNSLTFPILNRTLCISFLVVPTPSHLITMLPLSHAYHQRLGLKWVLSDELHRKSAGALLCLVMALAATPATWCAHCFELEIKIMFRMTIYVNY